MDTKNITFCGFMQRKEISPLMLDISNTFYYVMVLQDGKSLVVQSIVPVADIQNSLLWISVLL